MLDIFINLLTLKALSTSAEVYVGLLVVWILMLAAGIASVWSRLWPARDKAVWCIALVCLPVVAMTTYCLWSLVIADYSFLKVLGFSRKNTDQVKARPIIRPVKSEP